jgi:hypothetical protein
MFDPSAQYELAVCPKGRRPADEYYHQGQVWIEGREGSTYTLRFTNRSPNRVLVIFSVDGLDVLKGQPAGHLSEGYVVNGNSTLDIPGWKLDNATAAEFFFSRSNKSYVAKIGGNVNNTGVIGAMVFREAQPVQWTQPLTYTATTGFPYTQPASWGINTSGWNGHPGVPASLNNMSVGSVSYTGTSTRSVGALSQNASQDVATGFGQATAWNTVNTTFNREHATIPNAIMAIYYDSAKNLQRRGIVLRSKYGTDTSNNPFPAYTSSTGVTPPPGWKP